MVDTSDTPRRQDSTALARKRDALIRWLLLRHPVTAGMLAEIGLFPSTKKANRRLRRLLRRREVRFLGTVSLKGGRPEHVYGRGWWKTDNLLHEVELTRVCLKMDADEIRRGPGEVDPIIRPDAELLINGQRYFLELDLGTKSYPEIVAKRFTPYRSALDLVLWVCPGESRMEGIRRHAGVIRATALFTTLDRALTDPHGPIWVDVDGERASLPRSRKGGAKPGGKSGDERGAFSPPASGGATPSSDEGIEPAR